MAATLDAQPGEAMRRPRRAWIAVLLGLSFPSLAFFYLARPLAGACLSGLVLLLTLVVAVLHLPFGPVVEIVLGQIAINVGVAVWALRASRREPGRAPG